MAGRPHGLRFLMVSDGAELTDATVNPDKSMTVSWETHGYGSTELRVEAGQREALGRALLGMPDVKWAPAMTELPPVEDQVLEETAKKLLAELKPAGGSSWCTGTRLFDDMTELVCGLDAGHDGDHSREGVTWPRACENCGVEVPVRPHLYGQWVCTSCQGEGPPSWMDASQRQAWRIANAFVEPQDGAL